MTWSDEENENYSLIVKKTKLDVSDCTNQQTITHLKPPVSYEKQNI